MDNIIIQLIIGGILVYGCAVFYWLRVLSLGSIMLVWTCVAIVAPLYLAFKSFGDGDYIIGVAQIGCGAFLSMFWWIGAQAAGKWFVTQKKDGTLFRKWNAKYDD